MSTDEEGMQENPLENNKEDSKIARFDWSLKPLFVYMKSTSGINLNVIGNRRNAVGFLFPIFGLLAIFCNLAINGPCAFQINKKDQDWGFRKHHRHESPFKVAESDQYSMLRIVSSVCRMGFFSAMPLVHLTFMAYVFLTKNWKHLMVALDSINHTMKLSKEFHQKCRRHCYAVIFLFVLVT